MALQSMTGLGMAEGGLPDGTGWRWELRSVNGRGLDLRLRLPEGAETIELAARKAVQARLNRGNVTAALRLQAADAATATAPDPEALSAALAAIGQVQAAAAAMGLELSPVTADAVLRMPGVLDRRRADQPGDTTSRDAALLDGLSQALDDLVAARAAEGRSLAAALNAILDDIDAAAAAAAAEQVAQTAAAPSRLRQRVEALVRAGATPDPDRLAQELALLSIKQDLREELDRLNAHVESARALIAGNGPAGRRLDFLTQEFNREANTLCAKSDSAALTEAGLALKVLIDRLREQAQNVE